MIRYFLLNIHRLSRKTYVVFFFIRLRWQLLLTQQWLINPLVELHMKLLPGTRLCQPSLETEVWLETAADIRSIGGEHFLACFLLNWLWSWRQWALQWCTPILGRTRIKKEIYKTVLVFQIFIFTWLHKTPLSYAFLFLWTDYHCNTIWIVPLVKNQMLPF